MALIGSRLAVFVLGIYAVLWGWTWITADQTYGISVSGPPGESLQLYPGAFLGGLPPLPPSASDAPPYLAVLVGATGMAWVIVDLWRRIDPQSR